jgi:probable F420-dependent oxidoreductase
MMRTFANGLPTISLRMQNYAPVSQDWSGMLRRARIADEAGVDRILVADHLVLGEHVERYEGGAFPTGSDGPWLEPLTTLAVMAGTTTHVRLATQILLAALRRPIVLAKTAATLDVLSGGRLELGVGAGWQREEYAALGVDFTKRGRILDETLELCRRLWTETPVDYRSGDIALERIWCEPKPCQAGGVPVWIAGRLNRRVLDRIVRHATGWIPWIDQWDDVARGVEILREAFRDAGRDWNRFEVRDSLHVQVRSDGTPDVDATMADVPARVAAGITDFAVARGFRSDEDTWIEHLPALVQAFRVAVGRA